MPWPWREKREPFITEMPGWFTRHSSHVVQRDTAPQVDPRQISIERTIETVPAGERRELFNITTNGQTEIFRNTTVLSVEVSEIFILATVAGTVQILVDDRIQTPVIPVAINQSYSDSGFRLGFNSFVKLDVESGASIVGFLRWRIA